MYILIAGGGILGRNIAKALVKRHDVVVIDKDRKICENIYSNYGAVTVNGDATKLEILKEAGIEKCDIALGVMPNDANNLAFTILSKNFNVEKIFVRMREPEYKSAYEIAGATNMAAGVDMLVDKFVMDIEQPEIRRVASFSNGKAEVSIITIPTKAKCSGKTISEVAQLKSFPKNCVIAGIFDQENDKLIIPRGNRRIYSNNQVFLVGTKESIAGAAKLLMN
ncbi:potassium channel family protein [Sporosalibacterium faouarense]|uniref:potassium channel family protein n=1 Tax=Sporosalibacterium faouarense TaxID=516123 RepID=UPI00141D3E2F|nr:NAD-binding protein [Sporosalibacterium faouarense]MTI47039.1 TrkA family potassium uptake protein [Bacillota bacterium]